MKIGRKIKQQRQQRNGKENSLKKKTNAREQKRISKSIIEEKFPKIKQNMYLKLNIEEAYHVLENNKLE